MKARGWIVAAALIAAVGIAAAWAARTDAEEAAPAAAGAPAVAARLEPGNGDGDGAGEEFEEDEGPFAPLGSGGGGGPGFGRGQGMGPGPGMGRGRGAGPGMWHGMGRGGPGRGGMLGALRALDLSDAQRKQVQDLGERHQRSAIQSRADLQTARLDLRKLMRADTPNRRAIETQIDRIAGLRAGLEKDRTGMLLDVRALLTPEQRKQLESWREGRGPGRGTGPGLRRAPGGPWNDRGSAGGDEGGS
jgi:Spy/CpxP family protein refolding chaperone